MNFASCRSCCVSHAMEGGTNWQRKEVSRRVLYVVEAKYLDGFALSTSRVTQMRNGARSFAERWSRLCRATAAAASLVLFRQHDSNQALGDRRIGWVRRVEAQRLVVVVNLEKDHMPIGLERAEVVLLVRVVGVAKIVIDGDRLDDL